jgi:Tfp pilus assembly protein PilX
MRNRYTPSRHRGVAALVVTMGLFFAMLLVAVFANRNLVFEQRSSANQYRATQAFEAAEAGLEWAQAQLNRGQRIGADCRASADPTAASFRERYLALDGSAGAGFSGRSWNNAGVTQPLQASCVRADETWRCSCPSNAHPQLTAAASTRPAPAFIIEFAPGPRAGVVRVVARGCSSLGGVCAPGSSTPIDASARIELSLALLPGLASAPAAPLTARGSVNAPGASLQIHNPDVAAGGLTVHAGTSVDLASAQLEGPAGAALAQAVVAGDTSLATLTPDQMFAHYFGLRRGVWAGQPTVTSVDCAGNCAAALEAAAATASMIRIRGNAVIDGPVTLGQVSQPVLIVGDGTVQLRGPVTLNGLLYASALDWSGAVPSGASVRGALISESSYQGDGTPVLTYDTGVLDRLRTHVGTFARVSGSWRDF